MSKPFPIQGMVVHRPGDFGKLVSLADDDFIGSTPCWAAVFC